MHKKKTSLIPLMDEDGLVSSDCVQDLELPGSSSIDEESGRASTSPTFLTRRYQKNAPLTISSSSGTTCGTSFGSFTPLPGKPARALGAIDRKCVPSGIESSQGASSMNSLDEYQGTLPCSSARVSVDGRAGTVTLLEASICIQYSHSLACHCFGAETENILFDEILTTEIQGLKKARCPWYPFSENVYEMYLYTFGKSGCVWFPRKVIFRSPAEKMIESLHVFVQDVIKRYHGRPKNLLFLLNPHGGSKKATSVYEQNVLPILEKTQIKHSTHTTQYRGHAKDIINNLTKAELEELDGIVAVGGDGLFHEIVNALLKIRSETILENHHGDRIALGHIPAGSTDAVAYTLYGTRSAFTAAMHIALGGCMPLDVLRIDSVEGKVTYAVSMASYGYMGDLMEASERLRWMGPLRYDVVGAKMLLMNKSYHTTIEYLPAPEMHPDLSASVCTRNCLVCSQPSHGRLNSGHKSFRSHATESLSRLPDEWKKIEGEYAGVMLVIIPCRSAKSSKGVAKFGHINDGNIHLVLIKKCSRWQFLRFLIKLSSHGLEAGDLHEDYVDVLQIVAAKITHSQDPIKNSTWNIDGELLKSSGIVAESHRGAITVFSRGIENE